jgi:lipopolysaccharide biosynthesis glycosyltransferase
MPPGALQSDSFETTGTRRALVMAFDQGFALGGETALYSFLRFNPWFDATIVIFSSNLGPRARASLSALYPVKFGEDDPALTAIIAQLRRSLRASAGFCSRFGSLRLFELTDLDRAVFLDADTICLGDLRPLFEHPADFAAAPDRVELERALARAANAGATPAPVSPLPAYEPYGRALSYSFNSGVFSVSQRWLGPRIYQGLLQLPGFQNFTGGAVELADQYVLNHYFEGKVSPLDVRYNFVVYEEARARKLFGLELSDLRVLHFAGGAKPWELTWHEARHSIPRQFLPYYEPWYELREELSARQRPTPSSA